jgi:hypothetical protein
VLTGDLVAIDLDSQERRLVFFRERHVASLAGGALEAAQSMLTNTVANPVAA